MDGWMEESRAVPGIYTKARRLLVPGGGPFGSSVLSRRRKEKP